MERFTKRASKYLFALGGIAALIALQQYGISIPGLPDVVGQLVVGLAVAEGVYQVRNSQ